VIVPPDAFDFWLDTGNVDAKTAAALLAPAPNGSMQVYEVSPAVNRVANDSPALIEPIDVGSTVVEAVPQPSTEKPSPQPTKRRRGAAKDGPQGSLF
jgi:hypothetical protein